MDRQGPCPKSLYSLLLYRVIGVSSDWIDVYIIQCTLSNVHHFQDLGLPIRGLFGEHEILEKGAYFRWIREGPR